MQKIEYKIVRYYLLPTEKELNALGADGWLLAGIYEGIDNEPCYTFWRMLE